MKRLEVDLGGPVAYGDYGGEGPPMLLVHGIGGACINWQLMAPHLAERFHVLAIDLPGFGESPLAGRSANLDAQAHLVARFCASVLGGPAVVVGHSMGGLISILLGASHPEAVRGLVLIDPAFPPRGETSPSPGIPRGVMDVASRAPRLSARLAQALVKARGARHAVVQTLARSCADLSAVPPGFIDAHVEAERRRMATPGAYLGYLEAWEWVRRRFNDPGSLDQIVRSVAAPTLLMHGEEDRLVMPAAARRLAELQPGWKVRLLPGIGHSPNIEAPQEASGIILDWLGSTMS